jgi:hypothetical protein
MSESVIARMVASLPGIARLIAETKGPEGHPGICKLSQALEQALREALVEELGSEDALAIVLRLNRVMYRLR